VGHRGDKLDVIILDRHINKSINQSSVFSRSKIRSDGCALAFVGHHVALANEVSDHERHRSGRRG
jgi:hypothetical protein